MFEYHVANWPGLTDAKKELVRRAADGWELVTAYKDTGGVSGHVFIYKRSTETEWR